jgi:hypothetical protein
MQTEVEHWRRALHLGSFKNQTLALDFGLGPTRAKPPVPLADEALGWVRAAFRRAGANATLGTRLALLHNRTGLKNVRTFGVEGYLAPDDPRGPALLCGVVRTLARQIIAAGIATNEQIGIDTLEQRLDATVQASSSVVLPPALMGAWGGSALNKGNSDSSASPAHLHIRLRVHITVAVATARAKPAMQPLHDVRLWDDGTKDIAAMASSGIAGACARF